MFRVTSLAKMDDRQLNRWIMRLALILVVGIPLFIGFYWMDRHVDVGPSNAERAIAAAEASVRANPQDLGARSDLAAAYVSAQRYEEGIAQFSQILSVDPSYRAALLGRGIAYLQTDQPDLAKADLQSFVDKNSSGEFAKTDPQLEQAYYELGVVALQEHRAGDAVKVLESALAIDGGDADALYSFGTALIQTGDAQKGVAALRQAVMFVPTGWCQPYAALVDGYKALGNMAGVQYATGMVAFCGGQLQEAKAALQSLTNGDMGTDALLGLALVSAASGDQDAARAYYQQVLGTDPKNASAQIGLSQLTMPEGHPPIPAASPAATN
jgi:tetratricopeptide (TPR) repeat protein